MHFSTNFEDWEFACHDRDATPVPPEYVANVVHLCDGILEPVRARVGRSISVISGWRTEAHNDKVGGAEDSAHLTGEAADIRSGDPKALYYLILEMYERGELPALGGLGLYNGWVHVDTRRVEGHLRIWGGKGTGWERPAGIR